MLKCGEREFKTFKNFDEWLTNWKQEEEKRRAYAAECFHNIHISRIIQHSILLGILAAKHTSDTLRICESKKKKDIKKFQEFIIWTVQGTMNNVFSWINEEEAKDLHANKMPLITCGDINQGNQAGEEGDLR